MAPVFSQPKKRKLLHKLQKLYNQKKKHQEYVMRNSQPYLMKRGRARNRTFNRQYGLTIMAELSHSEFRRMFRMNREAFNNLARAIAIPLSVNILQAERSSGSHISIVSRLACCLRYLAGDSYLDVASLLGVSVLNFFHRDGVLWKTVDAIDNLFTLGLSLGPESLRQTANDFSQFSNGHMKGCVMAIDGIVIKTRQPKQNEVGDSINTYLNRKNCWGLVCMAGCDAHCRFTMFSSKCSGGTNDVVAWDFTCIKRMLDEGMLPPEYYFIGDEAFSNTN